MRGSDRHAAQSPLEALKGEARKNNCRCSRGQPQLLEHALHGSPNRVVVRIERAGILCAACWPQVLLWKLPVYNTIWHMLRNPMYPFMRSANTTASLLLRWSFL